MHEVSRVFPGSNLASDAPCGNPSASAPAMTLAPTPAPTPGPTSTRPEVHYRLHISLLLIFKWLLLLVFRA
jgi:hypothetical protein